MAIGGALNTFHDDEDVDERIHDHDYDTPADEHNNRSTPGRPQLGKKLTLGLPTPQMVSCQQEMDPPNIVYLMVILSAMGGFLFGYDTGIVSGAMMFVKKAFMLNSLWQELVVSSTILGAWILSLMAGGLSDRYGRKALILWASIVFTVGSIIMGVAWSKWVLLFGRLTVGLAIGLASTVVPMYIAEVAPSNIRGSLVTLNVVFITIGQLSAAITAGVFSYDAINGWRWMLALAAVPALIQFIGFMFMPESPRWLMKRGRDDEALAALKRTRGAKNPHVMREFDRIRRHQLELVAQEGRRKTQKRNIFVAIMKKTATRRALFVGCLLQAAQQLAGINTVMYYTATIIEMSGVQSKSIAVWLAVPTSAVYVIFSFCGYLLADRLGRRTLTLASLMGVIVSLLVLGTGFQMTSLSGAPVTMHNMSTLEACYSKKDCSSCISEPRCGFCYDTKNAGISFCVERNPDDHSVALGGECGAESMANGSEMQQFSFATRICPSMGQGIGANTWLVLAGLVMYLTAFAPGMSPMPWTINSEIYPMWARSFCYSIATSVNWMFNLLISLTFISLTEILTTHGTFYMYSIIASIAWILLFLKLPETRGRSLDDISALFAKDKSDDQNIMDDDSSNNNSAVGVSVTPSKGVELPQVSLPQQQHDSGRVRRNGRDNLAYANEYHNQQPLAMSRSVPNTDPNSTMMERSRSFKMAVAHTISQPEIQTHQSTANSSSSRQASNSPPNVYPYQQQHSHSYSHQQQQQLQQQQQQQQHQSQTYHHQQYHHEQQYKRKNSPSNPIYQSHGDPSYR